MLAQTNIEKVLFLDIETVPGVYQFDDLDEATKALWDGKSKYMQKDELTAKDVYDKAGIYAEFGKIICISVGFIQIRGGEKTLRLKSFAGHNEKEVLNDFNEMLNKHFYTAQHLLCAHNGKEFDFPYIARRTLVNGLKLPALLDIAGKKPWEISHLDTMELWKFGDYKHYTSLSLLTHIFNIPTPKDDITGADVKRVYYEEKDIDRIVTYCQKDVLATVQLFMRYKGEPLIEEAQIVIV
jgi:uncharacterized protein YprB with RNaseH-like and TPR domain